MKPYVAFYNKPKVRSAAYQLVVLAIIIWLVIEFVINVRANLAIQNQPFGFGFLNDPQASPSASRSFPIARATAMPACSWLGC